MVTTIKSKANGATAVNRAILLACLAFVSCLAAGCNSPGRFQPQANSARSLRDAKQREILATMVGLRYGETPAGLSSSPIRAAYAFDPADRASLQPVASYPGSSPAFTVAPESEAVTSVSTQPLALESVLSRVNTGVPIDLLLRIAAQSIGNLPNGARIGKPGATPAPGFSDLLLALRRLQLAGDLRVESRDGAHGREVWLAIGSGGSCESDQAAEDVAQVESLLGLSGRVREYQIVAGQREQGGDRIALVTRSSFDILSNLGAEIRLPGDTPVAACKGSGKTRATIVVHAGRQAPANADVSVPYRAGEFWIEQNDFDSRYALALVQNLIDAAESRSDTRSLLAATTPAY